MKTFWKFVYWMQQYGDEKLPEHCTVLYTSNLVQPGSRAEGFVLDGLLTAKLTLTLEDFERDCFCWNDLIFVSEKMRNVMALGPSDIQYFDVDASESAPLPRSKNYQTMHVPVTEDVSDLKNSDYLCHHHPDGSTTAESPYTLAFCPDAQPAHEIFYDRSFKAIFCTDELVLRVLRAGCTGAVFFDPSHCFGTPALRIRTLRGVEEFVKWDPSKNILRTKIIRKIS